MNKVSLEKKKLREDMQKLRNALSYEEVMDKSLKIHQILYSLDVLKKANKIMTYVSFKNEVDTIKIINELLNQGKEVIVPICNTENYTLIPSRIQSLDEMSVSYFGIMEPKKAFIRPVNPKDIDVILIPGLAFDKKGNRLGFGKGYYDRFLRQVKSDSVKIALAFSFQILDAIPVESWDVSMDLIITDKDIVKYKGFYNIM